VSGLFWVGGRNPFSEGILESGGNWVQEQAGKAPHVSVNMGRRQTLCRGSLEDLFYGFFPIKLTIPATEIPESKP
jgi:hypothetical protein